MLKIIIAPHLILEKIATPVEKINDKLIRTIDQMMDLMYDANGIGLAAPQVGISKRFFVMHIDSDNEEPYVFINPVIKEFSKEESEYKEGCLSFPKQNVVIHRPASIVVEYLNINGKMTTFEVSDEISKPMDRFNLNYQKFMQIVNIKNVSMHQLFIILLRDFYKNYIIKNHLI